MTFFLLAVYALVVVALVTAIVVISHFLGGRASGAAKNDPFESGIVPTGTAQLRFASHFYLVAMFFVIFDLEAVFLFAWAISVNETGWTGFIEAAIFIFILLAGLLYLWWVGALDWAPSARRRKAGNSRVSA